MRKSAVKGPATGTAKALTAFTQAVPHEMRKTAMAAALAVIMLWPSGAMGDWYGSEFAQWEGTTAATVRCLDRLSESWQARLNVAYEKLLAAQDTPERKAALAQAQRRWAAYRRANCLFYRQGPGSIAAIEAAECMRILTSRRARELEGAASPEPN